MVRALILLFFLTSTVIGQISDTVSIFKIRPPEKRIEGLFKNPIADGYLFLNYEGEVYSFKNTPRNFYEELIVNQNDFPFHKGTYYLERNSEKAIIEIPSENDTTFLLGKFRSNLFYLAYSDTLITNRKWNVGSFLISKTKEERTEEIHRMHLLSYNAKNCNEIIFWGGPIDSISITPSDTSAYKKQKEVIASTPINDILSFTGEKFKYFTSKYYTFLESDSQIVVNNLTDSCSQIQTEIDSLKHIETALHYLKRFGVKNYFIKLDSNYVWATKIACEIHLKFYTEDKVSGFLNLPHRAFFNRLKKLTPINQTTLNQTCEFKSE